MSYLVKFILKLKDPEQLLPDEIFSYNHKEDAEYHFNCFKEDDSDLYERIELIKLDKGKPYIIINSIDFE